ncbi:outer membrane lipoprotein carrier protein LolA [Henriciella barbarensis]|uniref:Outer membrane lipoprotein carrier protein LolA n=1 Tax=Henriciella barbarensis TaxID=86342 RepID=A0A399QZ60_9PROT|nr:outer membrane lipoprotein carrier protein LolA [Henriciella barbarensis]RIJ24033.1 outer membrane lipoprotein carrier protein LolA [Henriciella barbarensis]
MTSLIPALAAFVAIGTGPFALTTEFSAVSQQPLAWRVANDAAISNVAVTPVAQAARGEIVLAQADADDTPVTGVAPEPEAPRAEAAPVRTEFGAVSATERRAILKAAGDSLAAAKTARGRFVQLAPNGSVTEGDFALQRPGRMRFDYDEPTPILIVANGTTVAMEDSDLETVDRVPLSSTPLGLVLDDELDFETEARVTDVQKTTSEIAITMEDRRGEAEGVLTLYFDPASYQLTSWRTLDANQQVTRVVLEDIETNVRFSPRLFRLDDPADEEEDER